MFLQSFLHVCTDKIDFEVSSPEIYDGRGDRIRTCDILLPKQARYQAALHPDVKCNFGIIAEV